MGKKLDEVGRPHSASGESRLWDKRELRVYNIIGGL